MDEKCTKLLNAINENLKVVIANQAMLFCQIKGIEEQIQKEDAEQQSVPEIRPEENASGSLGETAAKTRTVIRRGSNGA